MPTNRAIIEDKYKDLRNTKQTTINQQHLVIKTQSRRESTTFLFMPQAPQPVKSERVNQSTDQKDATPTSSPFTLTFNVESLKATRLKENMAQVPRKTKENTLSHDLI